MLISYGKQTSTYFSF